MNVYFLFVLIVILSKCLFLLDEVLLAKIINLVIFCEEMNFIQNNIESWLSISSLP